MLEHDRTVATMLPPRPASARAARRFVTNALEQWSLDELSETTELLTSELVSNVVLHASSECRLRVRCGAETAADGVRVEVADASAVPPEKQERGAEAVRGRGLVLVDALASAWGVEPTDWGKVVWFELAP